MKENNPEYEDIDIDFENFDNSICDQLIQAQQTDEHADIDGVDTKSDTRDDNGEHGDDENTVFRIHAHQARVYCSVYHH